VTGSEREPFTNGPEPFTRDALDPSEGRARRMRNRPNLHCSMPRSLQYRLSCIIVAERRTVATVIDKVVDDYLSLPEHEPRPFIPWELVHEDTESRNYSLIPEAYHRLKERAEIEGRTVQVLFIRAVYDYVRASPDDPVKEPVVVESDDSVRELSED